MPRFDEDMTAEEWARQEEIDAAEDMIRFEREHRFREDEPPAEPESCIRWGAGHDRCVLGFDHLGLCRDADGNTALTIAAEFRRQMRDWRNDSGV